MNNVPIPSITDKHIVTYLRKNDLIEKWNTKEKNDKGEVVDITTQRPTYRQLCSNEEEWKHDKVFEWHEQHYDERGYMKGNAEKRLFSIHTYGRFFYKMTPKGQDTIFERLNKSGLSITINDSDTKKLYYDQHIQTPDELFRKIAAQTMLEYLNVYLTDDTKPVIKKTQSMLSQMLKKHPTFVIHINFLNALKIDISYEEEVDDNLNIIPDTLQWDNWYLNQIIDYAPYLIQRPYYNKQLNILQHHGIYAYHLITYQTLFHSGERKYLTNGEIDSLCGSDLKRVSELTPASSRVHYRDLNEAKKRLVRKCFSDVQGGIEKNHEEFIQELINTWLEKEKYTKVSIKRGGVKAIKAEFQKKYGKGWQNRYIIDRINTVINDIEWWDNVETNDETYNEYGDDTEDEGEELSFMLDESLILNETQDILTQKEKIARQLITDYIYHFGIFDYVKTMTPGTKQEILNLIKPYGLVSGVTFLNKIKKEILSGIWDGKSKLDYIQSYLNRRPYKQTVKKEL